MKTTPRIMGSCFFCIVENFLWIYIVVCEKISNFAQLKKSKCWFLFLHKWGGEIRISGVW